MCIPYDYLQNSVDNRAETAVFYAVLLQNYVSLRIFVLG
jgi:hypothetical protein